MSLNQLFKNHCLENGYKACEICGEYSIKINSRNKNPLYSIFCDKCHIRGAFKIKCVNCRVSIPIVKNLKGEVNKYCLMCHLSKISIV